MDQIAIVFRDEAGTVYDVDPYGDTTEQVEAAKETLGELFTMAYGMIPAPVWHDEDHFSYYPFSNKRHLVSLEVYP